LLFASVANFIFIRQMLHQVLHLASKELAETIDRVSAGAVASPQRYQSIFKLEKAAIHERRQLAQTSGTSRLV
jgi:hypothetical protein